MLAFLLNIYLTSAVKIHHSQREETIRADQWAAFFIFVQRLRSWRAADCPFSREQGHILGRHKSLLIEKS